MSNQKQRELERAVDARDDERIREATRNLRDDSPSHRDENANFIEKTLREHHLSGTREFGDDTRYDGVHIRTGYFPKIEVEEEPPKIEPKKPEIEEEDEDEDDLDDDFDDDDDLDDEDDEDE